MKILIATDSMKGSLSSLEAGEAIAAGIQKAMPYAKTLIRPLADGGEGTVEALTLGMGGHLETVQVTGPLGAPVSATYGILSQSRTAIMEMASAAGITLIGEAERNPLYTTTYGVGEMIRDAISKNCRHFIVGIGGSATNDGGVGMLQALGYEFTDNNGVSIDPGAIGLRSLFAIQSEHVIPELKECTFKVACDVTNPLCGELGCTTVFGPQKGATSEMISQMDSWLSHYAALTEYLNPQADSNVPGTGAAGGLGYAFLSYTNATLTSGVELILKETHLEDYIKDADLVITGEGRLDGQTAMGKAPIGVASLAKKHKKKVIAFSGCVTEDAVICNDHGIDAFFPILRSVEPLEVAMESGHARSNLINTVEQVFRLINIYS